MVTMLCVKEVARKSSGAFGALLSKLVADLLELELPSALVVMLDFELLDRLAMLLLEADELGTSMICSFEELDELSCGRLLTELTTSAVLLTLACGLVVELSKPPPAESDPPPPPQPERMVTIIRAK